MQSVAWIMLAALLLVGAIVFIAAAMIIGLLINRKTRLAGIIILLAIPIAMFAMMLFVRLVMGTSGTTSRGVTRTATEAQFSPPMAPPVAPPRKPPLPPPSKTKSVAEKTEQQYAKEAAQRAAAAVVQAVLTAAERALMDPEKALTQPRPQSEAKPTPERPRPQVERVQPPKRPQWVGAPAQVVHTPNPVPVTLRGPESELEDVYQMSIDVGPYTTRAECEEKLPDALQAALLRYSELCLRKEAGGVHPPTDVLRSLVKDQWEETRQYSVGPMVHLHALLQFGRKIRDYVLEEHRRAVVSSRIGKVVGWASAGFALIAVTFSYLKTDIATSGSYRRRLRLAAILGILAVIATAVMMV